MTLGLVLFGIMAFTRLPVREYPDIEFPIVSVTTEYPGASANLVETDVTRLLEESLSGIESVRAVTSTSREELSHITIEFDLRRDLDAATNDVRDRVSGARRWLPVAVREPLINKARGESEPVIWLSLMSDRYDDMEITDFAERHLKDKFAALPGVSAVWVGGSRRYAMRIWLDAERLASRAVTVQDVEEALRKQNVSIPSGRIQGDRLEYTVRTEGQLETQEQFNRLILAYQDGYPIRLQDVGRAEIGAEDDRRLVRLNGKPTVTLGVVKHSKANALAVSRAVRERSAQLQGVLPADITMEPSSDRSVHIERSLYEVYWTMALSVLLVVLVIFVFLRSGRATVIPALAIPASLLSTFSLMHLLGFSINLLTLLGFVLAIGLVVDDAIVMLENIYRHIEAGEPPLSAAITGSREIGFAVFATTLSLVAVFVPIVFLTNVTARLFAELAVAVAGSVLISGFIALTLTPTMTARMITLRTRARKGGDSFGSDGLGILHRLTVGYRAVLRRAVDYPGLLVIALSGNVALAVLLFMWLPTELAPQEDMSAFGVNMTGPEGTTLAYTDRYARDIESLYAQEPEVKSYLTWVGAGWPITRVNRAGSWVTLQDWGHRTRSQQDIVAELGTKMAAVPGVTAFPFNPPALSGGGTKSPVQFVISASSYEQLEQYIAVMLDAAKDSPMMTNMSSDLDLNKPELRVRVARDKAADLGVAVADVGATLETLLGGRTVTMFTRAGKDYPVIVKVLQEDRANPADISKLYLRGHDGQLVQMTNIATTQGTVVPSELNHYDRARSAMITAGLRPGHTLGEALAYLERLAKDKLPATASINYAGDSKTFKEASYGMSLVFLFGLLVVYLVLAAQFESFLHPIIILLAVPPALTGALLILAMSGGTLNVYTEIGLIMLIGLAGKNAILIVDLGIRLQQRGQPLLSAVLDAGTQRLRPILMTSLATILGAVPLATASGAGAVGRRQLGEVIIAGMTFSTVLTLFLVPAMYLLASRLWSRDEGARVPFQAAV